MVAKPLICVPSRRRQMYAPLHGKIRKHWTPPCVKKMSFTLTVTVSVAVNPQGSVTVSLKTNVWHIASATCGAVNVGVKVLAPAKVTGTPPTCVHWTVSMVRCSGSGSVAVPRRVTAVPSSTAKSAPASAEGALLNTVIVKLQEDRFPATSVAVHVTVVVPKGNRLPDGGEHTTSGIGSQISVAVAANVTTAPALVMQGTLLLVGQVITGGVVSTTVTVKLHEALFPLASVAVQVTVVVPIRKVLPDAGVQTITGFGSQMSVAVAWNVATAPAGLVHSRVIFAGQVMTGGVVSTTVTVKLHEELLPLASVAVQVTVVVPIRKVLPDAGVQTTTGFGSQISLAEAEKLTAAPAGLVHSTPLMLAGHVMTGGVVSTTVTVNEQLAELPLKSLAVHVTVVVPMRNVLPETGEQVITGFGSQISLAIARNVTAAPAGLAHSTSLMF
jgi:hypothetical protein